MSTREENLKKINAELEQLNDEELEQIAGGFIYGGRFEKTQVQKFLCRASTLM